MRIRRIAIRNIRNHESTDIEAADGVDCGCGVDDLMPCHDWIGDCVPARMRLATSEDAKAGWIDEGAEIYFPMEKETDDE